MNRQSTDSSRSSCTIRIHLLVSQQKGHTGSK